MPYFRRATQYLQRFSPFVNQQSFKVPDAQAQNFIVVVNLFKTPVQDPHSSLFIYSRHFFGLKYKDELRQKQLYGNRFLVSRFLVSVEAITN